MAIVHLPLPPGAEARALLHHLLEHGDLVGRDTTSRTIIQLAVDDWALEKFLTFNADAAELEDGGDDEPDADAEEDGSPTVIELMRPKVIRRRRHSHQAAWAEPMARRATIQLKVHRYIVQSIPLDEADIEHCEIVRRVEPVLGRFGAGAEDAGPLRALIAVALAVDAVTATAA